MLENLNEREQKIVKEYSRLHQELAQITKTMDLLKKKSNEILEDLEKLRKYEKETNDR